MLRLMILESASESHAEIIELVAGEHSFTIHERYDRGCTHVHMVFGSRSESPRPNGMSRFRWDGEYP